MRKDFWKEFCEREREIISEGIIGINGALAAFFLFVCVFVCCAVGTGRGRVWRVWVCVCVCLRKSRHNTHLHHHTSPTPNLTNVTPNLEGLMLICMRDICESMNKKGFGKWPIRSCKVEKRRSDCVEESRSQKRVRSSFIRTDSIVNSIICSYSSLPPPSSSPSSSSSYSSCLEAASTV